MRPARSPWPRIDAWLAAHAPEVLGLLRAPATAEALAKVEARAGRPLPASVREAYLAHDGVRGDERAIFGALRAKSAPWARQMTWLPLDRAAG